MATVQSPTGSVPQLMAAVRQLTPTELRDFKRRFAAWQQAAGEQPDEEAALVQACQAHLSEADERIIRPFSDNPSR